MNDPIARRLAEELKSSMTHLNRVAEIGQTELSGPEKAQFLRPLGEIMMKIMDELYTPLVHANPNLRELLFPPHRPLN